jgi:hypothetical protein
MSSQLELEAAREAMVLLCMEPEHQQSAVRGIYVWIGPHVMMRA